MVQDQQTIPEELYNLTQLAEVTLAAGRLSTTNINEITDYINKEKCKELSPEDHHNISNNLNEDFNKIPKYKKEFYNDETYKNDEQILAENFLPSQSYNNNCHTPDRSKTFRWHSKTKNSTKHSNFFSSSDDDSSYYSHKIFDRKTSRRSTFSDNSIRYDDISCSSTNSSEELLHHQKLNFKNSTNPVQTCGNFSETNFLRENSISSSEDEHVCPECGKKYSTSSNLARHRQTHRSISDKKARRCPFCEKVYVSMPAYSMHVRTHNQGCKCDHCGKCFSRPWLLQGHIRTHTGEKPFNCGICSKAFADKSNLRAHIQTHSNTKPHSCRRCGKSFALKSYLYKHEESSCMRNHLKQEKQECVVSKSSKMDSTKSTLASKILQKELHNQQLQQQLLYQKQQQQQEHQQQNVIPQESSPVIVNYPVKHSGWEYEKQEYRPDSIENIEENKSYTTLTSAMSQEEYDRFTRISVIRPPISSPLIAVSPVYDQNIVIPDSQIHYYQENPVDFSPKNQFSHSSKTSPFELTRNYAIVV